MYSTSCCAAVALPRHPRRDPPGALYHGLVHGLERGAIFGDGTDRTAFVVRMAERVATTGSQSTLEPTPSCPPGTDRRRYAGAIRSHELNVAT
jgi:hypothetical protein